MQIWVTKFTEEMAQENAWESLSEMAQAMVGADKFSDSTWIYDGEPDDIAEFPVLGTVDITILDYAMGKTYTTEVHAAVLRHEEGLDWRNKRMLIEVGDDVFSN